MSSQEIATPTAPVESAASTPAPTVETPTEPTVNVDPVEPKAEGTDPAPVESVEPPEKSKVVKELIHVRKRAQDAEREAAYLRGLVEGRGFQPQAAQPQPPAVMQDPNQPLPAPREEDFETWEDYTRAQQEYTIAEAERRMTAKIQAQQRQHQQAQLKNTFEQRIAEAAQTDPEIETILNDPELPVSKAMAPLIQNSDVAPALLRWLDKNREEGKKIAAMHPLLAAKELGRIEYEIKNTPKPPPPKKVSAAPEPIKTVTPASKATVDDMDLPIDEWMKRRNQEQYGRQNSK